MTDETPAGGAVRFFVVKEKSGALFAAWWQVFDVGKPNGFPGARAAVLE